MKTLRGSRYDGAGMAGRPRRRLLRPLHSIGVFGLMLLSEERLSPCKIGFPAFEVAESDPGGIA